MTAHSRLFAYVWPRSLFGRLAVILFGGLAIAHLLSFALILRERSETTTTMINTYLRRDIAASVAILERVPSAERPAWLPLIERRNYRYLLGAVPEDGTLTPKAQDLLSTVGQGLGATYPLMASSSGDPAHVRVYLRLTDGAPLAIEFSLPPMTVSAWVPLVLSAQLIILAAITWVAVRLAARPLAQLAHAADGLGPEPRGAPLPEDGPLEVARAARAFNAMQQRIAEHLAERTRILAAVSHDLQTPITRMRLRADLLDNAALREKLHGDLNAMQALVEEGIAYARTAHGVTEVPQRVDLHALLDSLVCDYADAGRTIRLTGHAADTLNTRPQTLRRIVANLIDNALKFGGEVEVGIENETAQRVAIMVSDRGPGIPPAELEAVMQPFYRLEGSRNRQTGGTGLGLAIAQQLTRALGGTLTLSNRPSGGLEARLSLPDLAR